jgi:hypothetical protein
MLSELRFAFGERNGPGDHFEQRMVRSDSVRTAKASGTALKVRD